MQPSKIVPTVLAVDSPVPPCRGPVMLYAYGWDEVVDVQSWEDLRVAADRLRDATGDVGHCFLELCSRAGEPWADTPSADQMGRARRAGVELWSMFLGS